MLSSLNGTRMIAPMTIARDAERVRRLRSPGSTTRSADAIKEKIG